MGGPYPPFLLLVSGMEKVFLINLGCPKNRVDSEVLLGLLAHDGLECTSSVEGADIVIVNTCAFIQEAVQESIEVILELAQEKKRGTINKLIVTGCLPQRYGEGVVGEIPEVDLWTGTGEFTRIPQLLRGGKTKVAIGKPRYLYDHHTPRIITNFPHSAYVKIAEGCSHRCTFCLIPQLRGNYRSRELDSVCREVEHLVAGGVVEINLVAQDSTAYGMDRGEENGLYHLLKALTQIAGVKWIRVFYTYPHPDNFSPQLLDMVAGEERMCPYIDMPIQHIDDKILQQMGRRTSGKEIRALIDHITRDYPSIHLRTTLMVGFPGEGEGEFGDLVNFVREAEFTHLGVFTYSPEEGTKASRMQGMVRPEMAEERRARIMELQQGISWKRSREMIGSTIPVLIDGVSTDPEGMLQGRTAFQAPEIDGVVSITKGNARIGDTVMVKITQAEPYDLVGEIREKG